MSFRSVAAKGLTCRTASSPIRFAARTYLVMANEGLPRGQRQSIRCQQFGAVAPLDRLRISPGFLAGNLYAAGARSFSIRRADGELVYDSGSILDRRSSAARLRRQTQPRQRRGAGRRRDTGHSRPHVRVIGLERTTKTAIAISTSPTPTKVSFLDMIVTTGDLSPEGLAAYKYRGNFYLAVANEVAAARLDHEPTHRCTMLER